MKKYEYIFVVLCYRNHLDLIEFVENIPDFYKDYRVVVVNSFYDDATEENIRRIAVENDCDFISVENKGYSYGNNKGIEYCRKHYDYDFLVVANPDVLVMQNDADVSAFKGKPVVVAPQINTLSGKHQNPYWVMKNPVSEFLIYYGYKHKKKLIVYAGIAINKFLREVFVRLAGTSGFKKVFAAHGSFMIFSKQAIEKFGTVFDDNMFLFSEEALLAHRLRQAKIPVLYTKSTRIKHKEDGSVGIAKIDDEGEMRKSIIYYYEKLH